MSNSNQARDTTGASNSSSELICRACKSLLALDKFSKSQMAPHNDFARRCKDCIERKFYGTMREDKKRMEEDKSLEDQIKKIKLARRALARMKFDMDLRGSTREDYEAGLKKEEAALSALSASLKSRDPAAYERKMKRQKKNQPTRARTSPTSNDASEAASPPAEAADGNAKKKAPAKRAASKAAVRKPAPARKPRAKKNDASSAQTEPSPNQPVASTGAPVAEPTPVLSKRAAAQAAKLSQWYTPPPSAGNETASPPPRRILTRGRKRIAEPVVIDISDDDSPQDKRTRAA